MSAGQHDGGTVGSRAPRERFDDEVYERVVEAAAFDEVVVEIRAGEGVRLVDARLGDGEARREIASWSAAELEADRGLLADVIDDFRRASGASW